MTEQKVTLVEIGERLRAPFPAKDIQWRLGATSEAQSKGLALAYLDARAIQRRLDAVFGWDGWATKYDTLGNGSGVVCNLCVRLPDDSWIEKADGADPTQVEATKGGISDAFKRVAASGFGIGRYLYDLDQQWVPVEKHGRTWVIPRNVTPSLPAWALPDGETQPQAAPRARTATPPPPRKPPVTADDMANPLADLEDTGLDEMRKCLGDKTWITNEQFDSAYALGDVPGVDVDSLNDGDLRRLYEAACKIKADADTNPASASGSAPTCPICGDKMNDKRKWNGKVAFKCVKSNWDKEARAELGCAGVIWMTDVDKHPGNYPPVQE